MARGYSEIFSPGTNNQGRMFALSSGSIPRTLPRTISRDSDVEKSLRGLTDDEISIQSGPRRRNKSKDYHTKQ